MKAKIMGMGYRPKRAYQIDDNSALVLVAMLEHYDCYVVWERRIFSLIKGWQGECSREIYKVLESCRPYEIEVDVINIGIDLNSYSLSDDCVLDWANRANKIIP
jgi:hypothetical protein